MSDDAPSLHEREVLEVVGEIVAAVRAADTSSEPFPGMAALEAVAATTTRHPGELGDEAMIAFVFLTGGDFDGAKLDAVDELLRSEPVNARVLDALRPAHLVAGAPTPRVAIPEAPADAMPLGAAASVLTQMLREAGVTDDPQDRLAALHAFVEFAAQPAAATPPLKVTHDTCFFEGWARKEGERVQVDWVFTRQFSLDHADGEYDHMEHLRLTVSFAAAPGVGPGASTPLPGLWAGDDLDAWEAELEQLAVIAVPADAEQPVSVEVAHENV